MTDAAPPRRSTAVYNPHLLARDELIATFAARQPLLDSLVDDLRRGAHQHYLIVGQRGAGKTTLLLRLAYAIQDDEVLGARAIALKFPEEQYNVHRVSDFWLNCVDALVDALETRGDQTGVRRLDAEVARIDEEALEEPERAKQALALLTGWAAKAKRDVVLLVDNLDLILDRLSESHWALRDVLSEDNRLIIVGGSSSHIQEAFTYQSAFYEFFKVHELHALDEAEARAMLLHLASATDAPRVKAALDEPGRFAALHLFSGGMPRTMVLLARMLASARSTKAEEDLEQLLDDVTPYYKARFEELPAQSQVVVDALALHYDPMTAADCSKRTGIEVTVVSAQLSRLVRQGIVVKLASADSSKLSFLIGERLFAIWYAMRTSRRLRRRLFGLVNAVKAFYGAETIVQRARELADAADDPARMLAFAAHVDDAALRHALEFRAIRTIAATTPEESLSTLLDMDGEDRHLVPVAERVRSLGAIRQSLSTIDADLATAICSDPFLSLTQKNEAAHILLMCPPRNESWSSFRQVIVARAQRGTMQWPNLARLIGSGESPSLIDSASIDDVMATLTQLHDDERTFAAFWLATQLDDQTNPAYRWLVQTLPTIWLAEVGRTANRPGSTLRLLELSLPVWRSWPPHIVHLPDIWQLLIRNGQVAAAADLLRASDLHELYAPLYEALRAAGEGRKSELVYLAPELRKPTEAILAAWFADDEKAVPYAAPLGGATKAAERRSRYGAARGDGAREARAATQTKAKAARGAGARSMQKPKAK